MSALLHRMRRVEERAGAGEAVWVFIEVAVGEPRIGEQIWRDMGWRTHPDLRDRPLQFYLFGTRDPGAPPRRMHPWPPEPRVDDGWGRIPPPGPPTAAYDPTDGGGEPAPMRPPREGEPAEGQPGMRPEHRSWDR